MIQRTEILLSPEEEANAPEGFIEQRVSSQLNVAAARISGVKKIRRSIDARGRQVLIRLLVEAFVDEVEAVKDGALPGLRDVRKAENVLVAGFGPAGMFAALKLIELGLKPVVIERGPDVKTRRRDLARINREGIVNPESNYCFGEGGAGTYSDGKLYTRSNKRGDVQRILDIFIEHGADPNISYEAHPHIGTNKLPQIVTAIRNTIEAHGGEVHFNTKLTGIKTGNGAFKSIICNGEEEIKASALILATGHSSRDIYELLFTSNILIEAKPFALGVRVEHEQQLIDSIQYHCEDRGPYLPPASYSLAHTGAGRGVFSFCMCPGGIIAPAATSPGEIVVNGWSPSKRNNPFANSGVVVSVGEDDFSEFKDAGPLAGMRFQQQAEQKAFVAGGGELKAPAQRLIDFIEGKFSSTLPPTSYLPGVTPAMLQEVLPPQVATALREGLKIFGNKMRGYLTNEAVVVGVESRTSSPVRIPRDKVTLQHPQVVGLYPCAEGAGYAGGIVSAAMDGENCAVSVFNYVKAI
jgi:uncharacterized FAD-dependent dehydrogenase